MGDVLDIKAQLEARTAARIELGRFVALLHHWAKRNAPDFDAVQRYKEKGYVYLSTTEAHDFLRWAQSLDRSCFITYHEPINWSKRWQLNQISRQACS